MNLEVKHLAAYLPYKIQYIEKDKDISTIFSLHLPDTEIPCFFINGIAKYKDNNIKLVLKPMQYLVNEIHKISPCPNFFNVDYLINTPLALNYEVVEKLFELHYDFFGLIKNNLAVDFNTIDFSKA